MDLRADVRRDGGGLGEISGAAPHGRDATTEPGLPRFLLGPGQTGPGGPAEGGGEPDPVPENRKQGGRHKACPVRKFSNCGTVIKVIRYE